MRFSGHERRGILAAFYRKPSKRYDVPVCERAKVKELHCVEQTACALSCCLTRYADFNSAQLLPMLLAEMQNNKRPSVPSLKHNHHKNWQGISPHCRTAVTYSAVLWLFDNASTGPSTRQCKSKLISI